MLIEKQLFETRDKVAEAIQVLRDLEPDEGYYVADSGGKDSDVIYALVHMAGVKADYHHNLTTIDPPEVIYHMRDNHKDTVIERPDKPLLQQLIKSGYPTRQARWCCALYKERGGENRFVVTGVRAQESAKRAGRKMVEFCYRGTGKRYLNIIRNWTDDEVWEFHRKYNIPYCKLYDEGWKRIGCLMCPNAGKERIKHAERYPKFKQAFIRAFNRRYQYAVENNLTSASRFSSGEEMFYFWLEEREKENPDQTVMFE
ncbi:MAG: phosphoadenosine phosphosulfate reductase family protein [Clostridiales bacterium]|nr:phosphoadenosine phosphosulfate reductase family protein [Clostridiales bacterium]